jgi:hypothetical protein
MSFDNSRFTFNPWNNYSGVVMEQGRVQLDSDWNEWLAELNRRIQAGTLDTLGRAVYPSTTPNAFQISVTTAPNTVSIGPGRMYVDGLLAENHGDPAKAVWDPALAEMSNTPQPPPNPTPPPPASGAINYTAQPYFPNAVLPAEADPFLAYLDVWTRAVTFLEDPNLIDKAVGVDTTGRLQTVWQVKVVPVPAGTVCATVPPFPAPSAGLLSTTTTPNAPSGPCCISTSTGYTGMENQFYRVEIHQPGQPPAVPASLPFTFPLPAGATFKFSRDNGSVMTGVTAITNHNNSAGGPATRLTVLSLGRDQTLGFAPGDWIEILDDVVELTGVPNGKPGELCLIDSVDPSGPYIQLTAPITLTFPTDPTTTHTRIVRWDQNGKIYESDGTKLTNLWVDLSAANSTGDIPVPPPRTMLVLENGVTVSFDQTTAANGFLVGDFWTFAARTADGSVESLTKAPPRGIHHHYAALSVITFGTSSATDCRTEWPPATVSACSCCCTNTVGAGAQYSSIQTAIQALPPNGGEICILPGIYYENVFIEGLRDIVIRGCGAQTRVASLALKPPSSAGGARSGGGAAGFGGAGGGTTIGTPTPYAAVFTVSGTQNITFTDFVIEAADSEVGILLDGSGTLGVTPPAGVASVGKGEPIVIDTTIENLDISASTMPAILAQDALLIKIEGNRIAMENVPSQWPAVWVTGKEIHIDGNWVGIQSPASIAEWLPAIMGADLNAEQNPAGGAAAKEKLKTINRSSSSDALFSEVVGTTTGVALHPGGIQIAARAHDVYVIDNEIDGGGFNGITLGSLTTTDANGKETGQIIGSLVNQPGPCSTISTLQTGGSGSGSQTGLTVVAGGALTGIQIERNRIRKMGLCGIGPAGFFDLSTTTEVISVTNLNITGSTIQNTLLVTTSSTVGASQIGYGAICLPDVQNLIVRDNTVTDFGDNPGADVCGVYILHGEMIEINRNQITETRDWLEGSTAEEQPNAARGGIFVALATPPAFPGTGTASLWTANRDAASAPIYEPSLPSLRVEHNVVRVPLAITLYAFGFGPFSIVDNHLSCGGTVVGRRFQFAQTVFIVNLGLAIEIASLLSSFSQLRTSANTTDMSAFRTSQQSYPLGGTVLFTNNICQLEKAAVRLRPSLASVAILSLDSVIFSNNQCWADGLLAALLDAFLFGVSVQVTSNRFQETLLPLAVIFSGLTIGLLNITAQNISTLCLLAYAPPTALINVNNIALVSFFDKGLCEKFQQG